MYTPEPKFPWVVVGLLSLAAALLLLSIGIGVAH